jgi:hypothetical protein
MAKPTLKKTYSTFTDNIKLNRADEIRRDNDTIKTPKCTIYDVDYAIISYLRDIIQPQIVEHDAVIDVPIKYASGEKWSSVRARGYMIDQSGKLMTPVIALRRNSIIERDTLKKLDVNWNPPSTNEYARNTLLFHSKYTRKNQYDRFSVSQNTRPSRELYVSSVPEYVEVSYELSLWTQYNEQMNSLIEQIMPAGGYAWGTTWKFVTQIQDYTFEQSNGPGEERIVRAILPLTVKASLLMPFELHRSAVIKQYSVKRVVFGNETDSFNVNIDTPPPNGY